MLSTLLQRPPDLYLAQIAYVNMAAAACPLQDLAHANLTSATAHLQSSDTPYTRDQIFALVFGIVATLLGVAGLIKACLRRKLSRFYFQVALRIPNG